MVVGSCQVGMEGVGEVPWEEGEPPHQVGVAAEHQVHYFHSN